MKFLIFTLGLLFLSVFPSPGAVDRYDRSDAWEYELGKLLRHEASSMYPGFDVRDLFGGLYTFPAEEAGHFAFGDFLGGATVTNMVSFETVRLTPLTGYKVALGADAGALRMASQIILQGKNRASGAWETLDQFTPLYSSVGNANHYGPVCETNRSLPQMFIGKEFKFLVVNNPDNLGPRFIEADAVTAENRDDPIVNVASPLEGTVYNLPAEVPIRYTATDSHEIDSVEVSADNEVIFIGPANGSITWTNSVVGSHVIRVKAFDRIGGETLETRNITVVDPNGGMVRMDNPRATASDYSFEISGYTIGSAVYLLYSEDLLRWTELMVQFPSEPTWTFSEPRVGNKPRFYKAEERR